MQLYVEYFMFSSFKWKPRGKPQGKPLKGKGAFPCALPSDKLADMHLLTPQPAPSLRWAATKTNETLVK